MRYLLLKARFQSPSGVLGVSRGCLPSRPASCQPLFQSPSGVLGVSRSTAGVVVEFFEGLFQSPSGVLGVSRRMYALRMHLKSLFQSPSGVLGVSRDEEYNLLWEYCAGFSPLPGF